MLAAIIVVLIILWFLGYISVSGVNIPDLTLFIVNGHPITLWSLLIFALVAWAISLLPRPLQAVASILLLLWVLSVLGLLPILTFAAFGGLSSLLVILIIVALAVSFVL